MEGVGPVETCRPTQVLFRTWRMPNVEERCDSESQHTPELDGCEDEGYDIVDDGAALEGNVLETTEEAAGLESDDPETTKGWDIVHLSGLNWTSL